LRITQHHIVIGLAALLVVTVKSFRTRVLDKLSQFIPSVESFDPHPYWDVSRYSWGYGTAAPGETGIITRAKAFTDMIAYLLADYSTLSKRVTRNLTVNQWVAFLSFSYNLGIGNAFDLVPYINAGDFTNLGVQWQRYVHADGVVNQELVKRRQREWALWNS
jgi:GH24 family phage-related lysozyme (muramidase)